MDSIFRRTALASLGIASGLLAAAATYSSQPFAIAGAAFAFAGVGLITRYGLPS
jgi:hypothetical protein